MKKPSALFLTSAPDAASCPEAKLPEFALIGRSNVGKSTLLNLLAGERSLAKVSATPGRTRMINFFVINDAYCLVDLPGYGYAKMGKAGRGLLENAIAGYLSERKALRKTFVLIDSRLSPQKIDLEFLEWMTEQGLPFALVFTKTDKLNPTPCEKNQKEFLNAIAPFALMVPEVFPTSSISKKGIGAIRAALAKEANA